MIRRLTAIAAALTIALPAYAKWYEVEVLVFEHITPDALHSEVWPADIQVPSAPNAVDILAPSVPDLMETSVSPTPGAPRPTEADPGANAEAVPSRPSATAADKTTEAAALSPPENAAATGTTPPEQPYQLLSATALRLNEAEKRLERAGYRPLVHIAWRQPVAPLADAVPVRIVGGKDYAALLPAAPTSVPAPEAPGTTPGTGTDTSPMDAIASTASSQAEADNAGAIAAGDASATMPIAPPTAAPLWELEGLVTFAASPYLTINTDLVLREPDAAMAAADTPAPPHFNLYELRESRRLKSLESAYLDHPLMGMLVQVRPYEPPAGSTDAQGPVIDDDSQGSEPVPARNSALTKAVDAAKTTP